MFNSYKTHKPHYVNTYSGLTCLESNNRFLNSIDFNFMKFCFVLFCLYTFNEFSYRKSICLISKWAIHSNLFKPFTSCSRIYSCELKLLHSGRFCALSLCVWCCAIYLGKSVNKKALFSIYSKSSWNWLLFQGVFSTQNSKFLQASEL